MVYCQNCGKAVPDESKFCTFCGTPVPVVDPQNPNIATRPSSKPVDVSRTEVKKKTINEFYKNAGFWGAIIVIAGFFLPFAADGSSLFDAVKNYGSAQPAVYIWLVFPVAGLMVLLHSLVPGWPSFISTIFIIIVIAALALFVYTFYSNPSKYFNTDDPAKIATTAGIGMWATLIGTLLLLFHRKHKRVEVHKTKVIDRNL